MERNSMMNEEKRARCKELTFFKESMARWASADATSALQQFMPIKAEREEGPQKNVFDRSSPAFQPVSLGNWGANTKLIPLLAAQENSGINWHGGGEAVLLPAYPSQASNSFDASVQHHHPNGARSFPVAPNHSIPVAPDLNLLKPFDSVNGVRAPAAGSTNGAFRTFTNHVPTAPQLTIFYAGAVHVYDDIPLQKAQAVMSLASNRLGICHKSRNMRTKAVGIKAVNMSQNLRPPPTKTRPAGSVLLSSVSVASHSPTLSTCGSNSHDDTRENNPANPAGLDEYSKTMVDTVAPDAADTTLMDRAVPMARKASIARFLEKRKGRLVNAPPHISDHKITKMGIGTDKFSLVEKSIVSQKAPSSKHQG